eukprot:CAMPEP_0174251728 /NCGR_PEP_ID=MMETSP0439-20130205/1461_1 /TAXON_ID=0 /ORGANISM="Stereomyxa ramosa, Strain Chinc5" /LENGTH=224 /DNA_ID=CAMNT_0015332125 /DNA_START=54 /DNA_END=728 /DNA_ORIENTATION=-
MATDSGRMGPNGLPDMDKNEKAAGASSGRKALVLLSFIPLLIGFGIAYAVYKFGSTGAYDRKILTIIGNELHWGYLAALIFARLVSFVNLYPMIYKAMVMRSKSGNLRANMYIYKHIGDQAVPGAVVFEEEGEVGKYNRANRSMNHFVENMGGFMVSLPFTAFAFPFPTFVLSVLFFVGRVLHQMGYTNKGYGGHALGFAFALLATVSSEGLLLVVALKAFALL